MFIRPQLIEGDGWASRQTSKEAAKYVEAERKKKCHVTSKGDAGVDICRRLLAKYPVTDTKTRFSCRLEHLHSRWRAISKEKRFLKASRLL